MRILITAGPTREAIDSVRYISNRSSGKMGYALAAAARDAGAKVMLVDMNEDALRGIVSDIGEDQAAYTIADVSDADQTQASRCRRTARP